ncbi:MAG: response regulator transcription factor [Xanthobacteraceae bacterium]
MPAHIMVAIVEDDASARAALVSLVGAFGYAASGFADADSFLASGAAHQADCLITDVRLPGLGGLALYRRLPRGRALPTIVVTGFPDEASRAWALRAGIVAYLAKPVEPERLLACLRTAIAGRGGTLPSGPV